MADHGSTTEWGYWVDRFGQVQTEPVRTCPNLSQRDRIVDNTEPDYYFHTT